MKILIEKYDKLQSLVQAVKAINEANAGNYSVYFDEYFIEVSEDDVENGEEYTYSDLDERKIRDMQVEAWNELIDAFRNAGYEVSTPYDSSIYITKNGVDAISIRDHEVRQSTMNHWNSVYGINILTDYLSESTLAKILK
jgi:hypothetical protein